MAWAKQLHDELADNIKKQTEMRLPNIEALATIKDEEEMLAKAFSRVAELGNSHHLFQDMIFKEPIVSHFFEISSFIVRGLHPEAKAFLEMTRGFSACQLSRPFMRLNLFEQL